MGKASRKKQSASQSGTQTSEQASRLTGLQTNKLPDQQTGKLVSRQAIHILIILVIGFLAYSNTFQSPFQWDEADYIVTNPIVKDLSFFSDTSRAAHLMGYNALKSRYIGYLTFALNYKLHGVNVFGYHVVNLVIHLVNAILLYLLVLLTFQTPFFSNQRSAISAQQTIQDSPFTIHYSRLFAFAVALLFVAHPVQTEAVTYVFQRLASLVSMFYLMSLVLYIKGRLIQIEAKVKVEKDSNSTLRPHSAASALTCFILSFISAILAMKTKENAFTLPVIITLYEFLFFSGPLKTRVLRLVPFLMTMLIIPMTIMRLESTAGEIISQIKDPVSLGYQELSRKAYFLTQLRVIVTYIRLLFFPVNQNIDYDYPIYNSFFELPVLLSFVFLSAIFGIALYLLYKSQSKKSVVSSKKGEAGKDRPNTDDISLLTTNYSLFTASYSLFTLHYFRLIGFGILWFFITLSVESSIIPIPMVIDEYRAYLPSAGLFIAVTAGVLLIIQRLGGNILKKERVAAAAFISLAVILSAVTYARNTLWQDKVRLWEDVVAKNPNSPRGYNNLGIAYNEKGMNEEAIAMYKRCIELSPFQKDVHINLGAAYAISGQTEKAIEEFTKAIAINPMSSATYSNLALLYAQTSRFDKAAETYTKAIELDPYNSTSYHGLGTSYMRLGRVEDALGAYTKFVSLSPNDPEAYRNRGLAYSQKGDLRSAREDFQKSCSLGSSQGCESLERIR